MLTLASLALALALPAAATEIPQGAHLLLRMENSISTRTAQQGDYVYMRTASPIAAEGKFVVPTGSYVQGVVSYAKRSGRVKGRAELGIRLETITLPSGKSAKFTARLTSVDSNETGQKVESKENTVQQGSSVGHDVARIAILAGSGAAIGGIADHSWRGAGIGSGAGAGVGMAEALLTRGREVELRHGATLDVVFDRVVAID